MDKLNLGRLIFATLLLSAAAAKGEAAVISSAPFSIGLGYSANTLAFDNAETAGANTPTTIGDFSFAPTASTDRWSSRGVTFDNRVLGDGPADNDYSANIDVPLFLLPVTASYNGLAPGNAAAIPDYKLQLEITRLSIYAGAHGSSSLKTLAWDETTPGHAVTSPSVTLPEGTWDFVSGYTQLVWDPADHDQSLVGLNDPYTRTFDIFGGNGLRYGDGIEVEGRVHLIYNAVPEPGTLMLAAMLIGIAVRGRVARAEVC